MAQLSQSERDIIGEYPLNGTLEQFRDILSKAEQAASAPRLDTTSNGPEKPRLFAAAMGRLIHSLMESDMAINLPSKTENQALASNLLAIRLRIQKRDLDHSYFRALSRFIIDNASDIDIWDTIFNLINILLYVTPPTIIAPTFDGTPTTRSSSSFKNSEQTRKNLEPELFYEINNCTYRNVRDFFDKYFEKKNETARAKKCALQ